MENCQVICRACHKSKTGHDIGRIRKADRQRDKSTGAIRPKQTIPHRPKVERVGRPSLPPRIMFWPIHGSEESGD